MILTARPMRKSYRGLKKAIRSYDIQTTRHNSSTIKDSSVKLYRRKNVNYAGDSAAHKVAK